MLIGKTVYPFFVHQVLKNSFLLSVSVTDTLEIVIRILFNLAVLRPSPGGQSRGWKEDSGCAWSLWENY
jgi:hypothetical protein